MIASGLSRRQFLERLGTLGGLGEAYYGMQLGLLPLTRAYAGPPQVDQGIGKGQHVIIPGAGIAGLCAAYLPRDTRLKVTIIKPSPYVGGRCLTLRNSDIVAEENVEKGESSARQNMPGKAGGRAYYKNQAENPDYLTIDKSQGRLLLAGDYFSFYSGWMEGAVLSAELAVKHLARMAAD